MRARATATRRGATRGDGATRDEGVAVSERKEKEKKTNRRVPRVHERKKGAAGAREKRRTTPPRVCQREGGPMYLLRKEKRLAGTRK
jgi:hypothetical protein